MFCNQCEQTANGGCSAVGVCGKQPQTSDLQDVLVYSLVGLAYYGQKLIDAGKRDEEVDKFIIEGLFTTVTNVNFDDDEIIKIIKKAFDLKSKISEGSADFNEAAKFVPADSKEALLAQYKEATRAFSHEVNEDIRSLRSILLYGLKGMAAYADHAWILGKKDDLVTDFFYKALLALVDNSLSVDDLVGLNLECGKVNIRCMELLDEANTGNFGHPEPTQVSLGAKKGPAILVSGHDLYDLKQLLEQTEGKGVNIYTHSEMLPANAYPELKKYSHLAGNYGGAWQDQAKEFAEFPGAILMTTNCIQKPKDSYQANIFTTGLVQWPGVTHIDDVDGKKDFSAVIDKAIALGGYKEDVAGKEITIGFARNTVLSVADKVIEAVKGGAIKHFFLIGGCDGAKTGRNYYTEFAEKVPQDSVILTLACGKYRFNKLDFGDIGGIPRLLDVGQCNDAYSAVKIALALADAFETDVNSLPLSLILSWYEQKAVVILLSLFSLGIQGIKLGPSLPAFVTPNVLDVLVKNFAIAPIKTAEEDLKEILG